MPNYRKSSVNNGILKNTSNENFESITVQSIEADTINVTGNIVADGYYYANGLPINNELNEIDSKQVSFIPSKDWKNSSEIHNVANALNELASAINQLKTGNNFTIPGPFANDVEAEANGVIVGQIYYSTFGGLLVRQV